MSLIRQSFLAVMLVPVLSSLAMAQTEQKVRKYGINLGANAERMWSDDGSSYNSLSAGGTLFFLNQNFHFGPGVLYSRSYSDLFQSTRYGLAAEARWTLENVQTADRTPFVELAIGMTQGTSDDFEDATTNASMGFGYEVFLNSFVSFAPSIYYSKTWSESKSTSEGFDFEDTTADTAASLQLSLNVYL